MHGRGKPGHGLQKRTGEVLEGAVKGAIQDLLKTGILIGFSAGVWLAVRGGSLPLWIAILVVFVVLLFAGRRIADLNYALTRHNAYTRHVAEVLDYLQRVLAGDLAVPMREYIERGVLDPARAYLTEDPAEEIRLSILTPDPNDETRWRIALAAGHSVDGRANYNEPIAATMSRFAFETGQVQKWDDAQADRYFIKTPAAKRPVRTMISAPVRRGQRVVGVLNVISSHPFVFDPAEERYIASIAGAINVAVSVKDPTWLQEQTSIPGP